MKAEKRTWLDRAGDTDSFATFYSDCSLDIDGRVVEKVVVTKCWHDV